MHWMQAERIINRLGLNAFAIKNEKLEIIEILIKDRCKSLLKAYHPDTKIETTGKKFQEISEIIGIVERYGIKTIYLALNECPKKRSQRNEILEKVDAKLTGGLQSGSMGNLSELKNIFDSGKYFFDLLKNAKENYLLISNLSSIYKSKSITLENALEDKKVREYFSWQLIYLGKKETKKNIQALKAGIIKNKENRKNNIKRETEEKNKITSYSFLEKELGKCMGYWEFQEKLLKAEDEEAKTINGSLMNILGSKIWKRAKKIKNEEKVYGLETLLKENFGQCSDYRSFIEKFRKIEDKEYSKINEFLKAELTDKETKKINKKLERKINIRKKISENRLDKLQEEIISSYNQEIRLEKEKENLENLKIEEEYTINKKLSMIKRPLEVLARTIRKNSSDEEIKLFNARDYHKKFMDSDKPRYSTLASIYFDNELNINYYIFKNLTEKFAEKNENYQKTNRKLFGIINNFDLEKNNVREINPLQLSGRDDENSGGAIYKETIKKLSFFNNIHNNPEKGHIEGNYSLISVEFIDEQPVYRIEGIVKSDFFKDFSNAITKPQ